MKSFKDLKRVIKNEKVKNFYTVQGQTQFFARKGDKPEKGGVDVETEGLPLFFVTLQFNHIYSVCVGKVKFPLLLCFSSVF